MVYSLSHAIELIEMETPFSAIRSGNKIYLKGESINGIVTELTLTPMSLCNNLDMIISMLKDMVK